MRWEGLYSQSSECKDLFSTFCTSSIYDHLGNRGIPFSRKHRKPIQNNRHTEVFSDLLLLKVFL